MRGRPSVWVRTRRLEGRIGFRFPPDACRYAADLAAASGLDPAAVLAEARAVLDRARADGARTAGELAAWIGREEGRDAGELLAEAEAAWRAGR